MPTSSSRLTFRSLDHKIYARTSSRPLDETELIDYRRLSMIASTTGGLLSRQSAEQYAEWFRALADPTRVQLLAWLARQPEPVPVGELTAVLPVGQSTVSHHLAALAAVGFVHVRKRGTNSLFAVNPRCLECFPSAADVVMGRRPPEYPAVCGSSSTDPRQRR